MNERTRTSERASEAEERMRRRSRRGMTRKIAGNRRPVVLIGGCRLGRGWCFGYGSAAQVL